MRIKFAELDKIMRNDPRYIRIQYVTYRPLLQNMSKKASDKTKRYFKA